MQGIQRNDVQLWESVPVCTAVLTPGAAQMFHSAGQRESTPLSRPLQGCCVCLTSQRNPPVPIRVLKQERAFSRLCSTSEQKRREQMFCSCHFFLQIPRRVTDKTFSRPTLWWCGSDSRNQPGSAWFCGPVSVPLISDRKGDSTISVCLCVCGVRFQELVVMGAPGSYYWTGTIKVYNLTSDSFYSPNKENVDSHRYSYLGNQLF